MTSCRYRHTSFPRRLGQG